MRCMSFLAVAALALMSASQVCANGHRHAHNVRSGRQNVIVHTGGHAQQIRGSYHTQHQTAAITQSQLLVDCRHRGQLNQLNSFRSECVPVNTPANIRFVRNNQCYQTQSNLMLPSSYSTGVNTTSASYLMAPAQTQLAPVTIQPDTAEYSTAPPAAPLVQRQSVAYAAPAQLVQQQAVEYYEQAPLNVTNSYYSQVQSNQLLALQQHGYRHCRQGQALRQRGHNRQTARLEGNGRAPYRTPLRNLLFGRR